MRVWGGGCRLNTANSLYLSVMWWATAMFANNMNSSINLNTHTHRRLLHVTTQTEMSSCNISTSRQRHTAATFDNVASSKTLAWSLTSSRVQQKSNHQKLFCCLLSYHFLPHPVSHGLYAVTAGKNNMGALFYSLFDFTDASNWNTLMQVWCIAEINRWINNAPYTTSRNPWHKQVL